jgi:hypothetical protein
MAAAKAAIFLFPQRHQKAPKARQPRWQIAPCAQHALAFVLPTTRTRVMPIPANASKLLPNSLIRH